MPQSRPPRPGFAPAARPYARKTTTAGKAAGPARPRTTAKDAPRERARPGFAPATRPYRTTSAQAQATAKPRARKPAEPAKRGPLTPSQKRYLRGLAHAFKPVILIGQKGVTAAVLKELDAALAHHELVKVKLADADRESRTESIERIRSESKADLVQTIGHVACFFRPNPDESAFELPR